MHIYRWQIEPPLTQSIEHRCLDYCYTKLGRSSRYSTMHIYTWHMKPPSQLSIHALNTTTPNLTDLADIVQCTYMHGRLTPPSQSSTHALHTITSNWADLADIIQMYIYTWQIDTPQSIKHTCLAYCYTKLGTSRRYSTMHIYAWQIDPPLPSQWSINALNTTTPNLADIAQCTYMHCRLTPPVSRA